MATKVERPAHAVTGAFGFSGKYIAKRLLGQDKSVLTLTNTSPRGSLTGIVTAFPFNFEQPEELISTLEGVMVLYNTYWVRFDHPYFNHSKATQNSIQLIQAAKQAGVQRVVHISITNPAEESELAYFRGKAQVERELMESGLSYAILRPAVLFGKEDILINNIAWILRHLPIFGVFGNGNYKLQPIYVDDLAALAVQHGSHQENVVVEAIGPETFTYRELVQTIAKAIGVRRLVLPVPPWFGYMVGRLLSAYMGDVIITRQEIEGLMQNLLYVEAPPAGETRLTDWVAENASTLGAHYARELARRGIYSSRRKRRGRYRYYL